MSSGKGKRTATPTLFEIHWNRVILDEAHTIRNPKSGISKGCCALYASECREKGEEEKQLQLERKIGILFIIFHYMILIN